MIGAWRTKLECSVWPSSVVVGAVPGEDASKVTFAADQDAVGEFGSGGPDEAFGEAVRSRASRWNLHGVDPGAGQHRDRTVVNWPARSLRNRKWWHGRRVHRQVAGLLCGQAPVGAGRARMCGGCGLQGEEHMIRLK